MAVFAAAYAAYCGAPSALTRKVQARSWAGRAALYELPGATTRIVSDRGAWQLT